MATDEKYLDNLLKSLTENEQQPRTMEEAMQEVTQTSKDEDLLLGTSDDLGKDSDISEDDLADLFAEAQSEDEEMDSSFDDMEDWQSSLDELLAEADEQVKADSNSIDMEKSDEMNLFGSDENMDVDLAGIDDLFNSSDSDGGVEDDMLALLEGVKDDQPVGSDNNFNDEFAFDIFAEDTGNEIGNETGNEIETFNDDINSTENVEEQIEEKPEKRRLFFGKKVKSKKEKNLKQIETEEEDVKPTDKQGFFFKVLDYLTREEDESDDADGESAEALEKADKENQKKARKEEKKKKKADKKKKGKSDAAPEGEADGDAEADTDKKKKKKEKKEKKKKEKLPEEETKEKPVKILSRRNILVLVAACATLTASICLLSTFLPEYADRKNARQAFYDGDYEETYRLLYDKNLNNSDEIIYNRVRIVLTIERKLKSYENNLSMGRKLEALDALMQGISCHHELDGIDAYGVRGEVDAIYQQICTILQNDYDISPEEAIEINAYDNETYTRKLDSIINGTEFVMPGEEPVEELPPQDILPEEEEIISY